MMPSAFKHKLLDTGVYCILNTTNGKRYVGGAYKSFAHRKRLHWKGLQNGRHCNQHLRNAWNKYGPDAFVFLIIERCVPSVCAERETHWIAEYNAVDRRYGYNKSPTGGSPLGTKHPPEYGRAVSIRMLNMSEETKAKIGAASRGRKHSAKFKEALSKRTKEMWANDQEYRDAVINSHKGPRTKEHRENISKALTGRKLSEAHKRKCAVANLGKKRPLQATITTAEKNRGQKRTPEQRARISVSITGRKVSDATRRKIGESKRKSYAEHPEIIEKISRTKTGVKLTEEHKAKIRDSQNRPETKLLKSEATKRQMSDPAMRQHLSMMAKLQWARIKEAKAKELECQRQD